MKKKFEFVADLVLFLLFIIAVVLYIVNIIKSIITMNIFEIILNLIGAIVLIGFHKLYEASQLD